MASVTDRRPTLYDVAQQAGVSLATASRVVNGSERDVGEALREQVLAGRGRAGLRPARAGAGARARVEHRRSA